MLSSAELTAMRVVQAQTFDLTGVIKRGGGTVSDGAGGVTQGSATTVATVACRLTANQAMRGEQVMAGELQGTTPWRITMAQGTDLRRTDRVEIGSRVFEVASIYGPKTNETALVALCVER